MPLVVLLLETAAGRGGVFDAVVIAKAGVSGSAVTAALKFGASRSAVSAALVFEAAASTDIALVESAVAVTDDEATGGLATAVPGVVSEAFTYLKNLVLVTDCKYLVKFD